MKPKIKFGLLVGIIGLVLNVCVAGAFGFCGPVVAIIAGAMAGFFTVREEKPASKNAGAQAGAISAMIAGGLILVGQVIGAVGALALVQASGMKVAFGQVPPVSASPSIQAIYYLTGMGTGVCFGLVGLVLAAMAGAGTGYVGTQEQPLASPAE